MNNEPVAWIAVGDNTSVFFDLDCALAIDDNPTPLYTHPAKTLTDEEIDYITKKYFDIHPEAKLSEQFRIKLYELEDFARAILRKAQEK